jgi:hypothetical protein
MGIDPLRFSAMSTLFPTLFNCFIDSDGPGEGACQFFGLIKSGGKKPRDGGAVNA